MGTLSPYGTTCWILCISAVVVPMTLVRTKGDQPNRRRRRNTDAAMILNALLEIDHVLMRAFRQPTLLGSGRAKGKPHKINNVVVFGETGVGKSSLINLLAGETISETSSSAVGCTLSYERYALRLGDQRFAVWDTAGLDEGSQGTEKAEAYLKRLLRDLAKASSVDLLIYCVRGTRVRSALLTNYHLFFSAICRKRVPIAIVITGLENQEGNMDSWWLKNERQFSALQMRFDNYACVTTLQSPMEDPTLEERRRISKATLIKMITSTCRRERWMPVGRSWADTAFSDIRSILSPREGSDVRVTNVIMCDVSRRPFRPIVTKRSTTIQHPVTLTLSLARLMCLRSPASVVNEDLRSKLPFNVSIKSTPEHLFRVHQVPWRQAPSGGKEVEKRQTMAVKRGADLLIFCVDVRIWECKDVEWQWKHFTFTYGGDLSPQIVLIIGATDQQWAEKWWREVVGAASPQPDDVFIAYWPMNESFAEIEAAKGRLRHLIHTRCIDCNITNFAGSKRIFNRHGTSPRLDRTFPSLCRPPVGSSPLDEPGGVDQMDVLTKWGVWDHLSTERDRLKAQ